MYAIDTDGLRKQYGQTEAVAGLDLTVESGEVFGFLGPNGAGKSTTINVLLGFTSPTSGAVSVLGYDVTSEARTMRSRVGLLPEGYQLYENLSGRHHVRSAVQTKDSDDDPDELLARVGLDSADARKPVDSYSKGMEQRLALAIALVGDPDLLILDEPTSGLDPTGIKDTREIVREERDRGTTVFFSSHQLDQVKRVCDRVGMLRDGELVAVGPIDELTSRHGGDVIRAKVDPVPDEGRLTDIVGVSEATVADEWVTVTCASGSDQLAVLDRLDRLTSIESFETQDSSLELVFESLADGRTVTGVDGGTR